MKKKYEKPMVIFENFAVNTNIAGSCEEKTNLPSNDECGMDYSGLIVFMHDMNGCKDIKIDEGEAFDGICYHVPSPNNNLFNS